MAQPTAVRRAQAVSATSNSTSFTPSWSYAGFNGLNTAISAGDDVMWICIVSSDGNPTLSINAANSDAAWSLDSQSADGTGAVTGAILSCHTTAAFAASAHPALRIDSTASEQYSATLYAYKAAAGSVMARLFSSANSGSSSLANPPSVTQNSGSTQDVTAIALGVIDSNSTYSSSPNTYGNIITQTGGGSNGSGSAGSDKQINALANGGTEDPAAFGNNNDQWVTYTVLVYAEVAGASAALTGQSTTAASGSLSISSVAALTGGVVAIAQGSIARATPITGQATAVANWPELVINGDGNSTTGWTAGNSGVLSSVGGRLRVTNGAALNGYGYQTFATVVGKTYRFKITWYAGNGGAWVQLGSTGANSSDYFNQNGGSPVTIETKFVATSTAASVTVIELTGVSGNYAEFDDISVQEVAVEGALSLALTGQSLSVARGSITAAQTFALTGQTLAVARDSVVAAPNFTLAGQAGSVARGTVAPTVTFALAGQSLSAAQGQVLQGAPIVGQILTAAQGSSTAGVSITLTGQSVSVARDGETVSDSRALTGQAVSTGQGSVVASLSFALAGQSLSVSRGSLLATDSLSLTGQEAVVSRGAVTATTDATAALTGQSVAVARGSVAASPSVSLSGQSATVSRGSLLGATSLSLTGQALVVSSQGQAGATSENLAGQILTASQGLTTAAVSIAISGQSVSVGRGSVTTASAASSTGQSVTVEQEPVTASPASSLSGQEIVASSDDLLAETDLSLTGQHLTSSQGTVSGSEQDVVRALTGQSLSVAQGSLVAAQQASSQVNRGFGRPEKPRRVVNYGKLFVQEAQDSARFEGSVSTTGTLFATEQPDRVHIEVRLTTIARMKAIEGADTRSTVDWIEYDNDFLLAA